MKWTPMLMKTDSWYFLTISRILKQTWKNSLRISEFRISHFDSRSLWDPKTKFKVLAFLRQNLLISCLILNSNPSSRNSNTRNFYYMKLWREVPITVEGSKAFLYCFPFIFSGKGIQCSITKFNKCQEPSQCRRKRRLASSPQSHHTRYRTTNEPTSSPTLALTFS